METQELSTKDKIAFCDTMTKFAYKSWNDRRQYEWKFTIALWSVLVLGVGFFTKEANLGRYYWILAPLAFLIYFFWLRGIWCANEFDRQMQFHYQAQRRAMIMDPNHRFQDFPYLTRKETQFKKKYLSWRDSSFHYSHLTYFLTTIFLLALAYPFASGVLTAKRDERLDSIERVLSSSHKSLEDISNRLEQLNQQLVILRRTETNRAQGPCETPLNF